MECYLFKDSEYTFDFMVRNLYIIPLGTKIRNTKGDMYELRECQKNEKVERKFSRINDTKLRFMTYNNIKETFWLVKEELLTEEEKEFLKQILKFVDIKIRSISIKRITNKKEIHFNINKDGSGLGYWYYIKNNFFNGLETNKVYTLKELGLEEN